MTDTAGVASIVTEELTYTLPGAGLSTVGARHVLLTPVVKWLK